MLNELLRYQFLCPVCGRILYRHKIRGYWCPYCGTDLTNVDEEKYQVDLSNRLTARDENGVPYYIGIHTMRERTYPQDINITATIEILEKLCQYEEQEENNEE